MLRVENLSKAYPGAVGRGSTSLPTVPGEYFPPGGPFQALDRVTLQAVPGDIVCLIGPNASGKTTLLKILAGLVAPDSGRIEWTRADPMTGTPPAVGYSPADSPAFYNRLSGRENLRFFSRLRPPAEEPSRVQYEELEEKLGLKELMDLPVQKMSFGMRQRLCLARAFLHDPPLLLLDEPTHALDTTYAQNLIALVLAARDRERLVFWATPRVEDAWSIATRLAVFSQGKLRAYGAPPDLLRRQGTSSPLKAYQALLAAPPVPSH